MDNDVYKKYYKRVARRGWVKSIFIGLIIAFAAMLASAIVFFIVAESLYYVSIIIFAVCAAVSIPLFYFLKYRPDDKDVANAVDSLGLEERFITMLELEGSNSFIAQRQRQDAYLAASSAPAKAISIAASTLLAVLLIVFGVLAVGSTTYVGLADAGIAPGFSEVVEAVTDQNVPEYTVEYEEYDGKSYAGYVVGEGQINGERVQNVKEGGNCTTVYAEAMEDSVFYCWSDGNTNPQRTDTNIREDMQIYAVFLEVADGDGDGDGDGSGDGDESQMGEEEGEDGEDGDPNMDGDPGGTGAGEGYDQNNKIFDNQTEYETEIGSAVDKAAEDLSGGDWTDEQRDSAGGYFDAIS